MAAPVGTPAPSQACVFQVKSTMLSVAPGRNSLIVRVSQAALVRALSFVRADQMTPGSSWPNVGLPMVTSIWNAVSSPVHSCVV